MKRFLSLLFLLFICKNLLAEVRLHEAEESHLRIEWIAAGLVFAGIFGLFFFFYNKTASLKGQLRQQEHELEKWNLTREKLFSIIGHDVRGPIAMIPAIIFLFEEEEDSREKEKLLGDMKQQAEVSLETLDKVLYWGQSLVKGKAAEPQRFAAKQYTSGNVELKKLDAAAKDITIADRVASDIFVKADPSRFDFIIRNLLSNAIKYSHRNGLVELWVDTKMRPGYVVIAVTDSGIGIDEQALRSVFQPKHSTPGTAGERGAGIGLMVCKEFAVKDGGDLWVESKPGVGSTFYLAVPNAA